MSNVVETFFDAAGGDVLPASVEVHVQECAGPQEQRERATRLVDGRENGRWPAGLGAFSCFVSTDGRYVLTYEQWLRPRADPDPERPSYRLYRLVREEGGDGSRRSARCFPAAVYRMPAGVSAAGWIDQLQSTEDDVGDAGRKYSGGIAANFHVSAEDDRVLLLAEWESEEEAALHREEMVAKLLEKHVVAAVDHESRYTHFRTVRDISGSRDEVASTP
jgi:hypothetical protein